MCEACGGHEGPVGDAHPVMHLILLLQTPEQIRNDRDISLFSGSVGEELEAWQGLLET